MPQVKPFLFDVFGTLTDWHSSISRAAQKVLGSRGYSVSRSAFAPSQ